tara:strand:- start:420 stop:758 length:339 start_codon:yes stop_codon:yes gene_type:complete
MKIKILIVIFISLFTINANAGYIKGLGANSCGEVIDTINEGKKLNIEWADMMYTAWIQGYMSGLDDNKPSATSRLKNVSKDSLYFAVLNRCKAKPLDDLYEATDYVYFNQLQ